MSNCNPLKTSKLSIFSIILIFLCLISFACTREKPREEKITQPIKIYTSLFVFENLTKQLIPHGEIESLITKGVDPHNFEPSLKDIQKLYKANLVIYLGDTDVDRWIDKIKDELLQKGVKVLRLQDFLPMSPYKASKELDPHVWLDPVMTREIIKLIKDEIIALKPEEKNLVEKNYLLYKEKLENLDKKYREKLINCTLRDVISSHEFLNYLASRYNINTHFIVHEPEEEPSPKRIKFLKDFVKKNKIEYILTEPEGEKITQTLRAEVNLEPLIFNTYHNKNEKEYLSVMEENLQSLSKALKCKGNNEK